MNYSDFKSVYDALNANGAAAERGPSFTKIVHAIGAGVQLLPEQEKATYATYLASAKNTLNIPTAKFEVSKTKEMPAPSAASAEELGKWLTRDVSRAKIEAALAGVIFQTTPLQKPINTGRSVDFRIVSEIASYAAWHHIETTKKEGQHILDEVVLNFTKSHLQEQLEMKSAVDDLLQIIRLRTRDFEKQLAENDKRGVDAREKYVAAIEEVRKARETFIAGLGELEERAEKWVLNASKVDADALSTEAKLSALKEGVDTISVKKLWDDRAASSRNAFWGSAGILAVFLVIFPLVGFFKLDEILDILRHIGDAATTGLPPDANATQLTVATISRLVVITVPLALYFWIIKLLVRFNLHSLALMEDARQRHTMMDTYFHLIGERAATIEDRALILNALFRPTPGQGSDAVEPPFTDIVSKAMPKIT